MAFECLQQCRRFKRPPPDGPTVFIRRCAAKMTGLYPLVIIGFNERGEKRFLALSDGYRESKVSWLSLLQDVQTRSLQDAPKLATVDGALGGGESSMAADKNATLLDS